MSILRFPRLLMQQLRLSKPWRYKAPFLISVPYAVLAFEELQPVNAGLAFLMSCCTILGIAGFGYFLNDYADRDEDRRAGKYNVTATLSGLQLSLLLVFLLGLAIVPWVAYFPMDGLSIGLLAAEFGLFLLYSAPPFRLKERGLAGVLADAGYAHVVPALLAAHTFALLCGLPMAALLPYFICLGAWQAIVGIRNILLHQVTDFDKDLRAGTRTFAHALGLTRAHQLQHALLALEIVGAAAYLVLAAPWPWLLPVVYLGFFLQILYFRVWTWKIGLPKDLQGRLTVFFDDFYCGWLPLALLGVLIAQDLAYGLLAAAHLVLFPNGLFEFLKQFWGIWKWKFIRQP
jgi:1,4-dihydroxy-2-naphthoate octaprenyltransferase